VLQLIHSPPVRPARALGWLRALAVIPLVVACSSSEPDAALVTIPPAPTTTAELPQLGVFRVEALDVQALGEPGNLPDVVRSRAAAVLNQYLNNAVLLPLRTGEPAFGLPDLFAGPALERASGPDRAALVEEGLPAATEIRVEDASATLTTLSPADGQIALVVATIEMKLAALVGVTPVAIQRTGELILGPEGDRLKITGYHVRVTRDTPAGTTTIQSP
jgi:hypothetical protein